jgi:uncharacterized protein YegP (UPF0339 family)
MAGKFELFKDARGEFRFHLKAANGEIIASSEGYKSKAAAENGIKSVQTNAPGATVVDKTGYRGQPCRELVAFVEQFVDLTTRRLATVLAD